MTSGIPLILPSLTLCSMCTFSLCLF